jgi:hypothetical protein
MKATLRLFATLAALALASVFAAPASAAPACGRACLEHVMDQYLAALVKHDPSGLPLSAHVKFTEDTAPLKLGEGLWLGASEAPSGLRVEAVDPVSGQVGLFAAMKEDGLPVILIVRLKVVGGTLTEIEQFVQRDPAKADTPGMTGTRPGLQADVPPAERMSRAAMLKIAGHYFDSIEHSNGDLAPFADDCDRHEGGAPATHLPPDEKKGAIGKILEMGCRGQISSGVMAHINLVRPRRPLIVDVQKGLVFCFPVFIHRGDIQKVTIRGVPGVASMTTPTRPGDTHGGEVLKIAGGQIRLVEVGGVNMPHGLGTGWNNGP